MTMLQTQEFTITHPTDPYCSYDFYPRLNEAEPVVDVVHRHGRRSDRYSMTVEEARYLWLRLRAKGYERF